MMLEIRRRYIWISILGISLCMTVFLFFFIGKQPHAISIRQYSAKKKKYVLGHIVEIPAVNQFADRVIAFNAFLSTQRVEEIKKQRMRQWQKPTSRKLNVVLGTHSGYFRQIFKSVIDYLPHMSNNSNVKTVVLPWLSNSTVSLHAWSPCEDHSNMLIQTYYTWSVDNKLCSRLQTFYHINMTRDVLQTINCNENRNDKSPVGQQFPKMKHNCCLPAHFVINMLSTSAYYMHIHRDAIVTKNGDVISGNTKLVPPTCSRDTRPSLPYFNKLERIPLYEELFVINQLWGIEYYHMMIEVIPRIALSVDFLKRNPQIPILAPTVNGRVSELISVIGLHKSRLVKGVARAKIAYQPRTTGCGSANLQESQFLSKLYRDYITRNFPSQPQKRLILIHRYKVRGFSQHRKIEELLMRVASDYNMTYTLFSDKPVPSLNYTMLLFNEANVIVAPHGAGLSNMIFSQPGTFIVEGACDLPHGAMYFQRLAVVLGHRWHGILSRKGCIKVVDVSPTTVDHVVRSYLCEQKS